MEGLPDEVLQHAFSFASLQERLGRFARVCRRWRDLCRSAELLESVSACFWGGEGPAQGLDAFLGWLQRQAAGAGGVRHLDLQLGNTLATHSRHLALKLDRSLASKAGLVSLRLQISGLLVSLESWLPALSGSLRHLHIDMLSASLAVPRQLAALTALESLRLCGAQLEVRPRLPAVFPASLTSLHLGGILSVPTQLSTLSRLRSLTLSASSGNGGAAGVYVLASLPCLQRLCLAGFPDLPACLSQLRSLEALAIRGSPSVSSVSAQGSCNCEQLATAVRHLARLTELRLSSGAGMEGVPLALTEAAGAEAGAAAAAGAPHLRLLGWGGDPNELDLATLARISPSCSLLLELPTGDVVHSPPWQYDTAGDLVPWPLGALEQWDSDEGGIDAHCSQWLQHLWCLQDLPPQLQALVQAATRLGKLVDKRHGDWGTSFASSFRDARRAPGEPLLEAVGRALRGGAAAAEAPRVRAVDVRAVFPGMLRELLEHREYPLSPQLACQLKQLSELAQQAAGSTGAAVALVAAGGGGGAPEGDGESLTLAFAGSAHVWTLEMGWIQHSGGGGGGYESDGYPFRDNF